MLEPSIQMEAMLLLVRMESTSLVSQVHLEKFHQVPKLDQVMIFDLQI